MSHSPLSPSWYRVAELKPRLRRHAQLHPHEYRGQRWYVVRDPLTGRNHRFSPAAHTIIGLMNGQRRVNDIWEVAAEVHGDDAPTQDETIRLMAQLHAADLLKCDVPPDSRELLRRYADHRKRGWKKNFGNPLALRFPLLDPDRFLERAMPFVQPLFSRAAMLLWLAVVGYAVLLAVTHREALAGVAFEQALAPDNFILLWLSYSLIKMLHEFGHAFAVKHWGGEVHEMGISLLVLMPLPYVDASSAAAFRDKRRRIGVGAAGIMVELFMAALATFVWVSAEPGTVRMLAFDILLIGSISTLFFNGNPLLRFDSYYILCDATGIPNLASRANRYLGYLCQRYLFGHDAATSPVCARGERIWFVIYGIAAFVYKIFITFAIALFVSGKLLLFGILLALWAVSALLVTPFARVAKFLLFSPELARRRGRALFASGGIAALALALTVLAPFPLATRAEGIVWLPEQSRVRAGTDCELKQLLVPVNTAVAAGQPLLVCTDPFLGARIKLLEARLRELESHRASLWSSDRVAADIIADEIGTIALTLDDVRTRAEELTIRSPVDGIWIAPGFQDLPGQFVKQGDLVGYVVDFEQVTARIVVPEREIALVRTNTRAVDLRLAHESSVRFSAHIERELPSASHQLPSRALGQPGGGRFDVSSADAEGTRATEKVFQFDVALPPNGVSGFAGERVYARFDHGSEPLVWRWYRWLRRLFLRQFDV